MPAHPFTQNPSTTVSGRVASQLCGATARLQRLSSSTGGQEPLWFSSATCRVVVVVTSWNTIARVSDSGRPSCFRGYIAKATGSLQAPVLYVSTHGDHITPVHKPRLSRQAEGRPEPHRRGYRNRPVREEEGSQGRKPPPIRSSVSHSRPYEMQGAPTAVELERRRRTVSLLHDDAAHLHVWAGYRGDRHVQDTEGVCRLVSACLRPHSFAGAARAARSDRLHGRAPPSAPGNERENKPVYFRAPPAAAGQVMLRFSRGLVRPVFGHALDPDARPEQTRRRRLWPALRPRAGGQGRKPLMRHKNLFSP
ncbi:hypothetical protein AAFF_G00165170 [Aldrovandia affinis]|uniref:Uncharacterized protein n=1 Tax=Aldrovandia affinis TaxID=143900 RepID=A0AAD7RMQ7_9TELE|nr:hypothetical protein AAFF_G00165170 [Aldrovandia affinis]